MYRVQKAMNRQGVLVLTAPSAARVFRVVAYEDESVRARLAALTAGRTVAVRLHRVSVRSSVYRAARVAEQPTENIQPARDSRQSSPCSEIRTDELQGTGRTAGETTARRKSDAARGG